MNTLILPVKSNLRPKTPNNGLSAPEHHSMAAASHLLTAISNGLNIDEESVMEEYSGEILTYLNNSMPSNQISAIPGPGPVDDPANVEEDEDRPGGQIPEASESGGPVDDPANVEEDEDRPGGEIPEASESGGPVDDPANVEEDEDRPGGQMPEAKG